MWVANCKYQKLSLKELFTVAFNDTSEYIGKDDAELERLLGLWSGVDIQKLPYSTDAIFKDLVDVVASTYPKSANFVSNFFILYKVDVMNSLK